MDQAEIVRDSGQAHPILTSASPDRWVPFILGMVPDGAVRHRPSDIARVVGAAFIVAVSALLASDLSDWEQWFASLIADVPESLDGVLSALYFGALVGGSLVIVASAAIARRLRLFLSVAAAGLIAVLAALGLEAVVGTPSADALASAGFETSLDASGFVPVPYAASLAVLLAAGPFLTRPTRRLTRLAAWVGALAAVGLGEALPVALVAGVAVAWGSAALVHLAAGSPAGTPTVDEVAQALRTWSLEPSALSLDGDQEWGESRFTAVAGDTGYAVVVLGRDATDARLLAKAWRFLWYKDSGPTLALTRLQEVEHRSYLLLLADRAGVRGPTVVAAGTAGERRDAILVTERPLGRSLLDLGADAVTDGLLADAWQNVARLHDAGLDHGALRASNVVVGTDGHTALVDWARASTSGSPTAQGIDQALLLFTTAGIVGTERALRSAREAIGDAGLRRIGPLLQPSVLLSRSRREVEDGKAVLGELRAGIVALVGEDLDEPVELRRVSPSAVLMAAGAGLGVYLLLGEIAQVGSVGDVFAGADFTWIAIAFVISQTPPFASAIAMLGSVPVPFPLGPVVAVQFANNFTGLVGGTMATTALVIRFFQKQGQAVAVAVSSGVLNTLAGFLVQVTLVLTGLFFTASDFTFSTSTSDDSSSSSSVPTLFVALLVAGVAAAAVVLVVPKLRRRAKGIVAPQIHEGKQNLRRIAADPRKAGELFGGNLAAQLLFALTLDACLHAYGGDLPLLQLVVINSLASFLGGVAPIPGGMGVVEAGLIAGLTAAGVPESTAIATTFTHRLFTAYLPPIWGWFALRWLQQKAYV